MVAARKIILVSALVAGVAMVVLWGWTTQSDLQAVAIQLRDFHQACRGIPHTATFERNDAAPGIHPLLESLGPSEYIVASNAVTVTQTFRVGPLAFRTHWKLETFVEDGSSWQLFRSDNIFRRWTPLQIITDPQ
jgi:hypothetical protein